MQNFIRNVKNTKPKLVKPKKPIKYLTKIELDKFFETIANSNNKFKQRDFLIFKMVYFHALRCSELIKIKLSDLDFETNKIYIEATKNGKYGNEFLNPYEKDLILEYLEIRPKDKTDFLFISDNGGSLGRQRINTLFGEYAKLADLPKDRRNPHTLRHSLAVHCANKKFKLLEVQSFLRHKSPRTTEIYFQILEDRRIELQGEAFLKLQ